MTPRRLLRVVAGCAAVCVCVGLTAMRPGMAQQPLQLPDARLDEARTAYDATNYEQARALLDAVIAGLGQPGDVPSREVLASAYELRGRARLNLRDVEGARGDFRAMLLLSPASVLPAQAGPRAQTLFDEVRAATVGEVAISVTPADASVTLDGLPLAERAATLVLAAGTHTIAATRRGHRAAGQTFSVVPGAPPLSVILALERDTSSLTFSTSPPNVEVVLDGILRGVTQVDPSAGAGSGGGPASRPFLIEDLPIGRHRVEFRRPCFITAERSLDLERPDDFTLDLVRLSPAVAAVSITADAAGATIFVDETPRGAPPQVLGDICQGARVIEVRTGTGRHVRRFDLEPGQKEAFAASVRPAFAVVSDSGANAGVRGAPDLRLMAETAFQGTRTLTLFATADQRTAELLARDALPPDWLAFDARRRPIGGAATIGDMARRDVATKLTRAFDAQGVAVVARDPAGDRSDMLLILLAPGSAQPDVVRWKVDNPASVRQAVARLDEVPAVTRSSLGMLAIDVLGAGGAVVVGVEPGSSASAAGVQPGETVAAADGKPVASAAALAAIAHSHPAGQPLALEIRDRAGAVRRADVMVQRVPRLVELQDQTVLSNVLAVYYTWRLASGPDPLEEAALRLNLAGAQMRLESWSEARRELDSVMKLAAAAAVAPAVRASVTGTAQYLLGICAEATGDLPGAERAWGESAKSPGALLTDNGELLRELSERRLAELRQGRGSSR